MDFTLNERQLRVRDTLRSLLDQTAAPGGTPQFDGALLKLLIDKGFCKAISGGEEVLEATIVAEEVSRRSRLVPIGVHALVAPLLAEFPADPVALQQEGAQGPVRFGAQAATLIVLGDERASVYRVDPCQAQPVKSNYGYPVACLVPGKAGPVGILPAALVRRRWQLAISAEIVGAMDAAMGKLVEYLTHRRQFGRRLGSFQAIQHRLSELAVSVESTRILLREAAWRDDGELAATTACYAVTAARQVCLEAHQLSGARGFTLEFGLHQATLRLQLLSLEAGGGSQHAAIVALERWSPAPQLVGCGVVERNTAQPLKAPL
jgi:alkylation response protein AidB-like acyl-CoA dehydrogenase